MPNEIGLKASTDKDVDFVTLTGAGGIFNHAPAVEVDMRNYYNIYARILSVVSLNLMSLYICLGFL